MINLGHQNSSWRAGVVVDFVDNFSGPVMNLIKDLSEKATATLTIKPKIVQPNKKFNLYSDVKVNTQAVTKSIQDIVSEYEDMADNLSFGQAMELQDRLSDVAKSLKSINMNSGAAKNLFKDNKEAALDYLNIINEVIDAKNDLIISDIPDVVDPSIIDSIESETKDIFKIKQLIEELNNQTPTESTKDLGFWGNLFNVAKEGFDIDTSVIDSFVDKVSRVTDSVTTIDVGLMVSDEESAKSSMNKLNSLKSEMKALSKIINDPKLQESINFMDPDQLSAVAVAQERYAELEHIFESMNDLPMDHLSSDLAQQLSDAIEGLGDTYEDMRETIKGVLADVNISHAKQTSKLGKSLNKATRFLKKYDKKVEEISGKIQDSALLQFLETPAAKKISLAGAGFLAGSMLLSATNEEMLATARESQALTEGAIGKMDASFALAKANSKAVSLNIGEAGDNFAKSMVYASRFDVDVAKWEIPDVETGGDFVMRMSAIMDQDSINPEFFQKMISDMTLMGAVSGEMVFEAMPMLKHAAIADYLGKEVKDLSKAEIEAIYPNLDIPMTPEAIFELADKHGIADLMESQRDHFANTAKGMGNTLQNLGSTVTEFSYNYGGVGFAMKSVNKILNAANVGFQTTLEGLPEPMRHVAGAATTLGAGLFALGKAAPAIAETTAHTLTAIATAPRALGHIKTLIKGIGSAGKVVSGFSAASKAASGVTNLLSASTAGATIAQQSYNRSMFGSIKAIITGTAAKIGHTAATIGQTIATWAAVVPTWALALASLALVAALIAVIAIGVLIYKNWDKITAALKKAWEWVKNLSSKFIEFGKNLMNTLAPVKWLVSAFNWLKNILGLTGQEGDGFIAQLGRIGKLFLYISNPIGLAIAAFKIFNGLFDKMIGSSNPFISTIGKIAKFMFNFLNPIGLVINAFKWLGKIWKGSGDENEGFISKILRVAKILIYLVHPVGLIIGGIKLLSGAFGKMASSSNPVINAIGKVGNVLIYLVHPIGWIIGAFKLLTGLFAKMSKSSNPIVNIIGRLGSAFMTIINPINMVSRVFNWLKDIWKGSGDESEGFISKILRVVKTLFMVLSPIGWLISGIQKLIKSKGSVISFFKSIGSAITQPFRTITNIVQGAVDFLRNALSGLVNMIIDGVNKVINVANKVPGVNIPLIPRMGEDVEEIVTVNAEVEDGGKFKRMLGIFRKADPLGESTGNLKENADKLLASFKDNKLAKAGGGMFKSLGGLFKGSDEDGKIRAREFMANYSDVLSHTNIDPNQMLANFKGTDWVGFDKKKILEDLDLGANASVGDLMAKMRGYDMMQGPTNSVKRFMARISDNKSVNALRQGINSVGDALSDSFLNNNPITQGARAIASSYINAFKDPKQAAKQMWSSLSDNKAVRQLTQGIGGIKSQLSESFLNNNAVTQGVRNIASGYVNALKDPAKAADHLWSSLSDNRAVGQLTQGARNIAAGYINAFKDPKQAAEQMWSSFSDISVINNIGSKLSDPFAKIFDDDTIVQGARNVATNITTAFKDPQKAAKQMWSQFTDNKAVHMLKQGISGIGSAISNSFLNNNAITQGARDVVNFYVDAFKDPKQAAERMWTSFTDNKVVGKVKSIGSNITDSFINNSLIQQGARNLSTNFKLAFTDPKAAAKQFWSTISDNKAINAARDGITKVWNRFNNNKVVGDVKDKAAEIWDTLGDNRFSGPVVKSINKSFESLRDGFKEGGVYGAFSGFVEHQKASLASMWGTFKDSSTYRFVDNLFNRSNVNINRSGFAIGRFFKRIWSSIRGIVESMGKHIKSFFTQVWEFVRDGVTNAFNFIADGIKDAFTGLYSTISDTLVGAFAAIWREIKSIFSLIGDVLRAPFKYLFNFISTQFAKFFTNLITGFNIIADIIKKPFEKIRDIIYGAVEFLQTKLIELVNMLIDGVNEVIKVANKLPGVNIELIPKMEDPNATTGSEDSKPPGTDGDEGFFKQVGGFLGNLGASFIPGFEYSDDKDDGGFFKQVGGFFGGLGSDIRSGLDSLSGSTVIMHPVAELPSAPPVNNGFARSDIINQDKSLVNPSLLREYEMAMSDFGNHRMKNENMTIRTESAPPVQGSVDVTVNLGNLPSGSVTKVESKGNVNTAKVRSGSLTKAQKRNMGNSGGSNK